MPPGRQPPCRRGSTGSASTTVFQVRAPPPDRLPAPVVAGALVPAGHPALGPAHGPGRVLCADVPNEAERASEFRWSLAPLCASKSVAAGTALPASVAHLPIPRPYTEAEPPERPPDRPPSCGAVGRGAWTIAPWLASGVRPYTCHTEVDFAAAEAPRAGQEGGAGVSRTGGRGPTPWPGLVPDVVREVGGMSARSSPARGCSRTGPSALGRSCVPVRPAARNSRCQAHSGRRRGLPFRVRWAGHGGYAGDGASLHVVPTCAAVHLQFRHPGDCVGGG